MKLQNFTKNRLFCAGGVPILASFINLFVLISVVVIIILVVRMIFLKIKKSASIQEKNNKIKKSVVYVIFLLSLIVTDSYLDMHLNYENRYTFYLLSYIIPTLVLFGGIKLGEKVGFFNISKKRSIIIFLILLFFSSALIYKLASPAKDIPPEEPSLGGCMSVF